MNADMYNTIRDVVKMVSRVGLAIMPLCVIVYIGLQSFFSVSADTPETNIEASLEPSSEERTRAILQADLNEAWGQYKDGDFSDEMWEGVRAHAARNWNEQAKPKGWDVLGWEVPATKGPGAVANSTFRNR